MYVNPIIPVPERPPKARKRPRPPPTTPKPRPEGRKLLLLFTYFTIALITHTVKILLTSVHFPDIFVVKYLRKNRAINSFCGIYYRSFPYKMFKLVKKNHEYLSLTFKYQAQCELSAKELAYLKLILTDRK